MNKVIVFAGTNEARKICEFLALNDVLVTACVATEYGSMVLPKMKNLTVKEGRLSINEIEKIVNKFDFIIDATHPYAKIISQNIKLIVEKTNKEYLRIIRPRIDCQNVIEVCNISEACEYINKTKGNVLITTGSKELEEYTLVNEYKERLFFRFLPTVEALNECKKLSIMASNIICMQGPFTENINKALLEQINAKYLITKEAGKSGGFLEKIQAANKLGVTVILIGRPIKEEGLTIEKAMIFLKEKLKIKEKKYSHFPLFINITGKKIYVVGGGNIATRRVNTCIKFGANITVIAPQVSQQLMTLYEEGKIHILQKEYEETDINDAYMILAATNNQNVNEKVVSLAKQLNIHINSADNKDHSEFYFPAIFADENIIGGMISNNGNNHKIVKEKAAKIREFLGE